jgi:glycosyltransferase involved in cell wall biosynthesis
MKVLVASSIFPFVEGGSTFIVDWLAQALRERGHEVEVLLFPFEGRPETVLEEMYAMRLVDLSQHGDRLIAIRGPSHLLRHPRKNLWFIHHHRTAYDLWGTRYQDIPNTPEGLTIRDAIIHADNRAFAEAQRIFSNSRVVQQRLKRFNSVDVEVLYPPLRPGYRAASGAYGDSFLYVSRLTHHKRQWLAVEAMRHTRTPVRLVIAGRADPGSESYVDELRYRIRQHGLEGRVDLLDGWISEQEKAERFAACRGALYFPVDEDSYGYPTLEAFAASRPVISTTDAGGTDEIIEHGVNGYLVAPEPAAIAAAMDELFEDPERAQRMGEAGKHQMAALGIHWDRVVERLLL